MMSRPFREAAKDRTMASHWAKWCGQRHPVRGSGCTMDICDQLLVGASQSIQRIRALVRQVADSDLNVIIFGETGVGKELVAQCLHLMSGRRTKPLVKVNCAAIPSPLLESELFGYEKGAFTGADGMKLGKFELAHGGTILLDEIGDMPLALQAKMLQVLQDFQFSRLGGKKDVKVDCWVLAATNQELEQRVGAGLFREDLYYRLNIIRIFVPPLRERPDDVEPLIHHFAERFAEKVNKPHSRPIDNGALEFLREYSWPGNVRELKHTIERLLLLGDWEAVKEELWSRQSREAKSPAAAGALPAPPKEERQKERKQFPSLREVKKEATREAESRLISAVLKDTGWNRRKAARILGISYKALLYKIKEYGLEEARPEW
jgi:two-component system response regulator AtoC